MNVRERFHATCNFEKVDRPIYFDALGFWDETLARWHTEGLPETVIDAAFTGPDYFGFDSLSWLPIAANTDYEPGFWPAFEEVIVEAGPDYTIKRDVGGNTVRVKADGRSTIPQYLDHPVKTLKDFEDLRWRLDPGTPERFTQFLDFMIDMARAKGDETYTCAHCCGLFGMLRLLLGLTGLSVAIRRDPALLHAIGRQWLSMNSVLLRKVREKVPVDWVFFFEDMSYKNGPMISPKAVNEFMAPYYRSLIREVRAETDIRVFAVDSDGDVSLLIPLFMETGHQHDAPLRGAGGHGHQAGERAVSPPHHPRRPGQARPLYRRGGDRKRGEAEGHRDAAAGGIYPVSGPQRAAGGVA